MAQIARYKRTHHIGAYRALPLETVVEITERCLPNVVGFVVPTTGLHDNYLVHMKNVSNESTEDQVKPSNNKGLYVILTVILFSAYLAVRGDDSVSIPFYIDLPIWIAFAYVVSLSLKTKKSKSAEDKTVTKVSFKHKVLIVASFLIWILNGLAIHDLREADSLSFILGAPFITALIAYLLAVGLSKLLFHFKFNFDRFSLFAYLYLGWALITLITRIFL